MNRYFSAEARQRRKIASQLGDLLAKQQEEYYERLVKLEASEDAREERELTRFHTAAWAGTAEPKTADEREAEFFAQVAAREVQLDRAASDAFAAYAAEHEVEPLVEQLWEHVHDFGLLPSELDEVEASREQREQLADARLFETLIDGRFHYPERVTEDWDAAALDDRKCNIVNVLYRQQWLVNPDLPPTAFHFATAVRAVVRLIAYVPGGWQMLADLYHGHALPPTREGVRAFVNEGGMLLDDDELFISTLDGYTTGWMVAAGKLLEAYSERVVAAWESFGIPPDESELPHDPHALTRIDPDGPALTESQRIAQRDSALELARLRQAADHYERTQGGYKAVALAFGLPQEKFRRYLADNGLLRRRGRAVA